MSIRSRLDNVLEAFVARLVAEHGDNLRCVVQFGSTVQAPLKPQTDVDLLLVFESLPSDRRQRREITRLAELEADARLAKLSEEGYWLELSVLTRTRTEAERFSKIYLDMIYDAKIWVDSGGFMARQLDRMRAWVKRTGASRRPVGLRWLWTLPSDDFEL